MSQNYEMQSYQLYGVKRIKSYFCEYGELWKKIWGTSLFHFFNKTDFQQYLFTEDLHRCVEKIWFHKI